MTLPVSFPSEPAGANLGSSMAYHRRLRRLLALAALAGAPLGAAQESGRAPSGTVLTASIAAGPEPGADESRVDGKVVTELEVAAGHEWERIGLRAELAGAVGLQPDGHVALRPGLRLRLPAIAQLRVALDASNARNESFSWRYALVGVFAEVRLTGAFGLFAELDVGVPLRGSAGFPLLLRGGASARL